MTNRSTSSSSSSSSSSIGLVGAAGSTSMDDKRGAEDWRETQEGTMEANRGPAWGEWGRVVREAREVGEEPPESGAGEQT